MIIELAVCIGVLVFTFSCMICVSMCSDFLIKVEKELREIGYQFREMNMLFRKEFENR